MENMICFLPDNHAPFQKLAETLLWRLFFSDAITLFDSPHNFVASRFKTYDRISDPDDRIAHHRHAMLTMLLPEEIREVCFYKLFGNSLLSKEKSGSSERVEYTT